MNFNIMLLRLLMMIILKLLDVADKMVAEYHKTLDPLTNDLQSVF